MEVIDMRFRLLLTFALALMVAARLTHSGLRIAFVCRRRGNCLGMGA
jgi:hypothetical protein